MKFILAPLLTATQLVAADFRLATPFTEHMVLQQMGYGGIPGIKDLGEKNIHPTDKAPIGERLAYLALHNVHGKAILAEGPTLREAKIEGQRSI